MSEQGAEAAMDEEVKEATSEKPEKGQASEKAGHEKTGEQRGRPSAEEGLGTSKDERASGEAAADAQKEKAFSLFEKSLENVDWAYKTKNGTERELGHKSVTLAEKAYVTAGLYDKERADKMYEEVAGKPPKADLQQRVLDSQGINPADGIADLTTGIAALDDKREKWSKLFDKEQYAKQIGNWEVAIGDAKERGERHREEAGKELLSAEKPDQGDASGLGMLIRSVKGGLGAARDYGLASRYWQKKKELGGLVKDAQLMHGKLSKDIESFTQEKGAESPATAGMFGKNLTRFAGAGRVVNNVFNGMADKVRQWTSRSSTSSEPEGPGEKKAVPTVAQQAHMHQQGQGQGMGIG